MAKKGIVIYSSRTGYTKRYAEYLAKELNYAIKPLKHANLFAVSCYPTVIYGGGLHHNRIDGIDGIINGIDYFGEQNLIVYSVGLASTNDELTKEIWLKNFPEELKGSFLFQTLPGGLARKDCEPGGVMADKVAFYRQKRDENKRLTRDNRIALDIADGVSAEQDRFDTKSCDPIIAAARRHY